jgi:hypothetical protein
MSIPRSQYQIPFSLREWRLLGVIRRARRFLENSLISDYSGMKVIVRQGATHIDLKLLAFLVGTRTEGEAQELRQSGLVLLRGREALKRAGYADEIIPFVHFPIISQEMVDEKYAGNWSEAMDMP